MQKEYDWNTQKHISSIVDWTLYEKESIDDVRYSILTMNWVHIEYYLQLQKQKCAGEIAL